MNRKKELINEYKKRPLQGGVYLITNTLNGKYLTGYAANLKSVQSYFQFAATTGSVSLVHPKLWKDWEHAGGQAFTLEILEELEQKPEQSEAEFKEDLKTLEQLCQAKLDPENAY